MEDRSIFFSVIIPTYNRAPLLKRAMASVLAQSFTDFELIVVDDGSTDDTASVIKSIQDPRIVYLYQENKERSAARNFGIAKAKGEYISFLDSDDEYSPDYLKALYDLLFTNKFPIALIKSYAMIENGDKKEIRKFVPRENKNAIDYIFQDVLFLPCAAVHHDILAVEKFDEVLNLAEDTELWVRILLRHPLLVLDLHSAIIHVSSNVSDLERLESAHHSYILSFKKIRQFILRNKMGGIQEVNKKIVLRSVWLARTQFEQKKYLKAYGSILSLYLFSPREIRNFYLIKWLIKKNN